MLLLCNFLQSQPTHIVRSVKSLPVASAADALDHSVAVEVKVPHHSCIAAANHILCMEFYNFSVFM